MRGVPGSEASKDSKQRLLGGGISSSSSTAAGNQTMSSPAQRTFYRSHLLQAAWYCCRHVTIAAVTPSGGSRSWLQVLLLLLPGSLLPPAPLLLQLNWRRSRAKHGKLNRACARTRQEAGSRAMLNDQHAAAYSRILRAVSMVCDLLVGTYTATTMQPAWLTGWLAKRMQHYPQALAPCGHPTCRMALR